MKIKQSIDINTIVNSLIGKFCLENVDQWNSQIRALSKAITFVENDPLLAPKLLAHPNLSTNATMQARIIGITGLPGAGKSTLTNLIVKELRKLGKKVAIFAVDPSSSLTGGAILGDRVRMHEHFRDPHVFIRSMGSRGALGGVARATRSAIRLASVLNFDYILVETVGIGQSESEITSLADSTVLVLMPNSGDEIQLMKSGILQLANIYVVNKCDLADSSRMIQELMENTAPNEENQWHPPVLKTSAAKNEGISELVNSFFQHEEYEKNSHIGQELRTLRLRNEVLQNILILAEEVFREKVKQINDVEIEKLSLGKTTAMSIASELFQKEIK
ncbi:methylmalonyl Co-A mutase-associated GTPase MeaB [Pigmentibacter sp. JX0631]|uniref:methylmalonyl Co-A mutase-associated GTPase MeaB n=1 Tax=Pigmentibacter sp. JX0631 TaxID=2976982 RepID=UPI0024686BA7|nr:methylmalonyl Co-A mutase-associated GTPase MeaB [Pigmentibacter sp. JX0631]WGL60992.1 methylmalonyl Co-A mutase-associated GTPase MeaB [Pigmentibacter sp. JX0631]